MGGDVWGYVGGRGYGVGVVSHVVDGAVCEVGVANRRIGRVTAWWAGLRVGRAGLNTDVRNEVVGGAFYHGGGRGNREGGVAVLIVGGRGCERKWAGLNVLWAGLKLQAAAGGRRISPLPPPTAPSQLCGLFALQAPSSRTMRSSATRLSPAWQCPKPKCWSSAAAMATRISA